MGFVMGKVECHDRVIWMTVDVRFDTGEVE
jgi:hypothetical protein